MPDDPKHVDRRGFYTQGLKRALREVVGQVSKRIAPVRYMPPPGALPEPAIVAACTRCGECVSACPVKAIAYLPPSAGLAAGTPSLDVALNACIMCEDMPCAKAGPTPALEVPPWGWRDVKLASVVVDTSRCITWRDVECGICARVCPVGEDALKLDERGRPVIGAACTGCGQCIKACVTTPSSLLASPRESMS